MGNTQLVESWFLLFGVVSVLVFILPVWWSVFINSSWLLSFLGLISPNHSSTRQLDTKAFTLLLFSLTNVSPIVGVSASALVLGMSSILLYGGLKGVEHFVIPTMKKVSELLCGVCGIKNKGDGHITCEQLCLLKYFGEVNDFVDEVNEFVPVLSHQSIACRLGLADSISLNYGQVFGPARVKCSQFANFEDGLTKMCAEKGHDPVWRNTLRLMKSVDFASAKALYMTNRLSLEQICFLLDWSLGVHNGKFGHGESGLKAAWDSLVESRTESGKVLGIIFDTRAPQFSEKGSSSYEVDLDDWIERKSLHKSLSTLNDNSSVVCYKKAGVSTGMGKFISVLSAAEESCYAYSSPISFSVGTVFVGTGVLMFTLGCALSLSSVYFG